MVEAKKGEIPVSSFTILVLSFKPTYHFRGYLFGKGNVILIESAIERSLSFTEKVPTGTNLYKYLGPLPKQVNADIFTELSVDVECGIGSFGYGRNKIL